MYAFSAVSELGREVALRLLRPPAPPCFRDSLAMAESGMVLLPYSDHLIAENLIASGQVDHHTRH